MARMNIGYDLLTWEGDILRLHFWTHAFEFLKRTGAVFMQTHGRLQGCWVMRIEDAGGEPGGSTPADPDAVLTLAQRWGLDSPAARLVEALTNRP